MSSNDPRIQPLPSDVAAKVKSSTSITHLSGVIVELVKNSLDANAHSVVVTVDFQRGSCVVEDDGDGIPPAEFETSGGLGKAHHTSRSQPGENEYCRKGLFLASLACLSLLTITSHHVRHQSTNTVILHNSTAVARLVPAPVQQRLKFSRHGSRVTVNDLFGNMPVRVKSRALALQKPDDLEREWDYLRYLLVSLMLANDELRKLVLEDPGRSKKLTIRSPTQTLTSTPSQGTELDIHRIHSIFAQANIIDLQSQDRWNIVSAGIPNTSIHAAISLVPSPTKKAQFISFGTEPLLLLNSTNVLYGEINRLFALSDFGTAGAASAQTGVRPKNPAAQCEQENTLKSPAKTISRWPMFYIRVNTGLPQAFYDDHHEFVPESDKSVQHIMDVLAAMIYEFLKRHNLRPRAAKREQKTSQSSEDPHVGGLRDLRQSRCRRLERPDVPASSTEESFDGRLRLPSFQKVAPSQSQNFGTWSKAKGINGTSTIAKGTRLSEPYKPAESGRRIIPLSHPRDAGCGNLADDGSPLEDIPASINLLEQASQHQTENVSSGSADAMIPWVDPCTGKSHFINARTGHSVGPGTPRLSDSRPRSTGSIHSIRSLNSKIPATAIPSGRQGLWIENLLKKWDNPAFPRSERPLTSADVGAGHGHACSRPDVHDGSGSLEAAGYAKFRGKLRRQHLELAEVIAQVDRKFIFAKMKATCYHAGDYGSGTVLTLIDQHAADERCRVERLFEELFMSSADGLRPEINMTTLQSDSIVFKVRSTEVPLFRRYLEFFSSWGVHYSIDYKPGSGIGLGTIDSLPALIAERCRSEPNLAIDLIRAEIWRKEESGRSSSSRRIQDNESPFLDLVQAATATNTWVERLGGCPQGIIDLLNSRACRSAIMFNDALTIDECQNLVSRLARCVFPFQCAHGRPSMVPMLDMQWTGLSDSAELYNREATDQDGMSLDFVTAFKSWRDTLG